jgi:endonuclease YncB( thermonuclease family)
MVPRKRGEPKNLASPHEHLNTLSGKCFVIDGDTICIGKVGIRLAGIDAPELDHPWGKKAK